MWWIMNHYGPFRRKKLHFAAALSIFYFEFLTQFPTVSGTSGTWRIQIYFRVSSRAEFWPEVKRLVGKHQIIIFFSTSDFYIKY